MSTKDVIARARRGVKSRLRVFNEAVQNMQPKTNSEEAKIVCPNCHNEEFNITFNNVGHLVLECTNPCSYMIRALHLVDKYEE